jgi:hypothetical protein
MKNCVLLTLLSTLLFSCIKTPDETIGTFLSGSGVFILNEGNFRGGNGSVSFYSYDSVNIYNDLFSKVNRRPLGDVPNSMEINGSNAYIVVNNSGKIEVVDKTTLESVATISGLISPRNIKFINNDLAYVTSLYSDSVAIINVKNSSISGYINLRRTSESIVATDNLAFISNWVGGDEVMVINTLTNKIVDSVKVAVEPESMVLDRNNMLWVLCNGGWARNNFAELIQININTKKIEKRLVFSNKLASPSCLNIDGNGETLYYLDGGVRKMSIASLSLPSTPYIPEGSHYFYKFGINPVNGDIFITDAIDFQQQGVVMYHDKNGELISSLKADIIPGLMCFKMVKSY